jgi:hypothetical protein
MNSEYILLAIMILLFSAGIYYSFKHTGPDERCSKYRNITDEAREMRDNN